MRTHRILESYSQVNENGQKYFGSLREATFSADNFSLLIHVVFFDWLLMHIVPGLVIGGGVVNNAGIIKIVVSV